MAHHLGRELQRELEGDEAGPAPGESGWSRRRRVWAGGCAGSCRPTRRSGVGRPGWPKAANEASLPLTTGRRPPTPRLSQHTPPPRPSWHGRPIPGTRAPVAASRIPEPPGRPRTRAPRPACLVPDSPARIAELIRDRAAGSGRLDRDPGVQVRRPAACRPVPDSRLGSRNSSGIGLGPDP